jgi:hypothetical protein
MKAVVVELHPRLKRHGFRKRRHTLNREPEEGLVQVINFQMGSYDVGDPVEIPGLRKSLYGRFAVNLGVFLRDVHERLAECDVPAFVAEYHCDIRKRLGEVLPGEGDVWWNLEHGPAELAADVGSALEKHGVPWLDGLSSRASIWQAWCCEGNAIGFAPRGQLVVALMQWNRGEKKLAERLIHDYLDDDHAPGHADYVERVVERLGIGRP